MYAIGERILTSLWVGALWGIGYLAVPTLFASLDDRILAGMLAGKMFTTLSYLGLGVGAVLLAAQLMARGWREPRTALLVIMLGLVAVGEFGLQPMMAELKAQGLVPGSAQAAQFGRLHGVASILYLLNSLCGLGLIALGARAGRPSA